jgi:lysophospholipase L1-like esterase
MRLKFTLLFISLLITCILAEIILRQMSVLKTYTERNGQAFQTYYDLQLPSWYMTLPPNATAIRQSPEFDYSFKTNEDGLREEKILPKQDSAIRIIALGDSYTEGVGASDDSETWPKYLQQHLSASLNHKVEVINAGVSGSDPFQEYVLLRDKLIQYKPDLVIEAINNSDIDDYTFRGGMARFKPDGTTQYRKAPAIHPLYQYSFLFRLFTHTVLGYDKTFIKYSDRNEENTRACKEITEVLKQTDSLCNKNDSKLLVVIHDRGGEERRKYEHTWFSKMFKPFNRNISAVNQSSGLRVFDIVRAFDSYLNKDNYKEYVWSNDAHYTPKGYQLMASLISDSIVANEIIR